MNTNTNQLIPQENLANANKLDEILSDSTLKTISIIIPVYNEAHNISMIYQRITQVMADSEKSLQNRYEIIFIDDGSTDDSFDICVKLVEKDIRVRAVQFRRNYGKTAALQTGFSLSEGQYVVTIDCDMQEDPAELFLLIDRLNQGFDLVSGWRKNRDDPLSKIISSLIFNFVVSVMTRIPLHDFNCGFKAYRSPVVKEIKLYGELHRFIPFLAYQRGFRLSEVVVKHQRRKYGRSKFGVSRLLKGYIGLIKVLFLAHFQQYPLRFFGTIGTIIGLFGLLILAYLAILWFDGIRPIGDRPLMTLGVLLTLMGLQLFSTGLIGEILRNNSYKAGEEYSIRNVVGFNNQHDG